MWRLSVGAWTQHPGLIHALNNHGDPNPYKVITDCLHFCIVGDGQVGIYEAFNRLFWWQLLQDLHAHGAPRSQSLGEAKEKAHTQSIDEAESKALKALDAEFQKRRKSIQASFEQQRLSLWKQRAVW